MNSRFFFAGKLVGLGELTRIAVDLGESTVDICRGNIRRNSNPSVILDGVDHGLTAGMTETLVQPEKLIRITVASEEWALALGKAGKRETVVGDPTRLARMDRQLSQRRPCSPQSCNPFPDTALPAQHVRLFLCLKSLILRVLRLRITVALRRICSSK